MEIKALGEFVVLTASAKSAGSEIYSDVIPDLVVGTREHGEIPLVATVHAIGPKVPEGLFNLGDMVPLPNGKMTNVPHPQVALGLAEAKAIDQKFFSAHYSVIPGLYVLEAE